MQSEAEAAGSGRPDGDEPAADGLVSLLEVIEEQPLEARAESYATLHEELSARLEGADAPRHG